MDGNKMRNEEYNRTGQSRRCVFEWFMHSDDVMQVQNELLEANKWYSDSHLTRRRKALSLSAQASNMKRPESSSDTTVTTKSKAFSALEK